MKLREILTDDMFDKDESLFGDKLKELIPIIQEASEFFQCKIEYADISFDTMSLSTSFKHINGHSYKGKLKIYRISQTPEIYEPINLLVNSGKGCITPIFYDPKTFYPSNKIILNYNPVRKNLEDTNLLLDKYKPTSRKQLHDLLDDILDNNEKYLMKGEKGLIIKGYFEKK